MRIRVIEDDMNDLQKIRDQLLMIAEKMNVQMDLESFSTPDSIPYDKPVDCYILDIQLGNVDGFTICRKIRDHDTKSLIIFCSHHEELVFQSFRHDVFYFVRKEQLGQDMYEAMKRVSEHLRADQYYIYCTRNENRKLLYSDISFFESVGNDLYVYLVNGDVLRQRKSFSELSKEIVMDSFIQVSRNYIIQKEAVSYMTAEYVMMNDGKKIPIPKSQKQKIINSYFKMK